MMRKLLSLETLQYASFAVGAALLTWFAVDSAADELQRRQLLAGIQVPEPDTSLWSESRLQNYREGRAIGVIKIAAVELEAPIVAGTSEEELDTGAGWLRESSALGGDGNVVIAAHRDGYFRALKDLPVGAEIDIVTAKGSDRYRVSATHIVNPEDTWVLAETPYPSLTLITCYPFYYLGSAPQRFVVHADRIKPKTSKGA